jgi:MerR HTH family regulatory protein
MTTHRISQVAGLPRVRTATLCFYESFGLLQAERTPARYRTFDDGAVDRLAFISSAKLLGLEDISALLEAGRRVRGGTRLLATYGRADWHFLLAWGRGDVLGESGAAGWAPATGGRQLVSRGRLGRGRAVGCVPPRRAAVLTVRASPPVIFWTSCSRTPIARATLAEPWPITCSARSRSRVPPASSRHARHRVADREDGRGGAGVPPAVHGGLH